MYFLQNVWLFLRAPLTNILLTVYGRLFLSRCFLASVCECVCEMFSQSIDEQTIA